HHHMRMRDALRGHPRLPSSSIFGLEPVDIALPDHTVGLAFPFSLRTEVLPQRLCNEHIDRHPKLLCQCFRLIVHCLGKRNRDVLGITHRLSVLSDEFAGSPTLPALDAGLWMRLIVASIVKAAPRL